MRFGLFDLALVGAVAATATPKSFLPFQPESGRIAAQSPDSEILDHTLDALGVMQNEFFAPWIGTWPTSIDWTAAVMGTHVSGALSSLALGLELFHGNDGYSAKENMIGLYFSQVLSYYFGMDSFSIRNQAYDDILWVVLGWLETIQFIELHTGLHYPTDSLKVTGLQSILQNQSWHGNIWIPAFSHRSRVFWDLAEKGWDTELCGGGMNWSPHLQPYKNAITNELYIAASISMYLYSPGDTNGSPFIRENPVSKREEKLPDQPPHDTKHLMAAIDGYEWLQRSNMMNKQGLYFDGFHVSSSKKCDLPNPQVYTYNQGVLLTGQIGLYKATGISQYLSDGHRLIQNVIKATGYDLEKDKPVDKASGGRLPPWHGLGRYGVIEDLCDVKGDCSQNSHTFKGIFFHHLATFCARLESTAHRPLPMAHKDACRAYIGWIKHNAAAALATRNADGKFGTWWTAGLLNLTSLPEGADRDSREDAEAVDYRNEGVPDDDLWVAPGSHPPPPLSPVGDTPYGDAIGQDSLGGSKRHSSDGRSSRFARKDAKHGDLNDRGRGRTVETQGSGLALLRALWEMSNR